MSVAQTISSQLQQMSRALRWSIYALAGLALFLLWDGLIAPTTDEWRTKADAIQTKVDRVRAASSLIGRFNALHGEIIGIGPVSLPESESQGRQAIQDVIIEVLKGHNVAEPSLSIADSRVQRGTLAGIVGTKRLGALKADLEYTATPQDAVAIIAELEASPEIEFIRTIRMNKAPNNRIKVRLTLETWVLGA